ncbi:class I SAM-dependent methyltransferase [Tistrella mobilis]|uniref:Class I SAM-dependent methyltransferase n=1 Tax=Tistrella mobilis TaxID=171437 RepID=A0A161PZA8_9PROT|nr:class I SAM-dependent methyltransferase [Tistrella mobilis]KYO57337.1 hypothetical protein AUP44_20570 [Tistrella mobilis]MAM73656.1 class I SAM-dependent methyltransferase [Tistrella sp.]
MSEQRARRFALSTALGFGKRGYFIPYRYAEQVEAVKPKGPHPAAEALFQAMEPVFGAVLDAAADYRDDLARLAGARPPAPRWSQDWFPRLDALAAYTMVRAARPRRIIEIGSGHSTRFIAQALKDDGHGAEMTAIDPEPRAAIDELGIRLIRKPMQSVPLKEFAALGAGDMLVVDSSHILMPGSDVDVVLNRILPMLPKGVLVHFHDIFLPDGYPQSWAWRGYNEQPAVAALLFTGGYKPLFASRYVATRMTGRVQNGIAGGLPLLEGAYESSLWLEKLVDAAVAPPE